MSSFWTKLLCCQNAYKLCCRLVCHFYFSTSKMFFYIEWDQKKSLNFVWIKTNAFFIDLDRFLQQKEFIEVRLVYGFRQDCRKTPKHFMKNQLLFGWLYEDQDLLSDLTPFGAIFKKTKGVILSVSQIPYRKTKEF